MKSDKEIKKEFKKTASENPENYYPTNILKKCGFKRKQCSCGTYFWNTTNSDKCGDSSCSGGFRFFKDNPAKNKLNYIQTWKKFSKIFKDKGYKVIDRYPVVARWNPTMEYTMASIACFQPYVISGEASPPAPELIIPQPSIRFVDIDNVGITGSHMTCFVMIGQLAFVPPKDWSQEKYFQDIKDWLNLGLGLDDNEITFHEDAWAGGGNFGPCMEFFSRGVELGNQVYMMYEQTPNGIKELDLKVLDMGMGMERNAWFSLATPTMYDATFPKVIEKLRHATKLKLSNEDSEIYKKYVPYGGLLNVDEVEDINKAWKRVADLVGVSVDKLRDVIEPNSGLYSIAEHCRLLLFVINDGALPSNVGGGYNLRLLIRRCLGFIDKYNWEIYLPEVCKWHAEELKDIFPELQDNLDLVKKVLDVEKNKYEITKEKSKQIVDKSLEKGSITTEKLIELYDSQGINPYMVQQSAKEFGKIVEVPDNFYSLVSERHDVKEQVHQTSKTHFDLSKVKETKALYFDDYKRTEFEAEIIGKVEDYLLLKETYFYPTSGGQINDTGMIGAKKVVDVIKQGKHILHKVPNNEFKVGDKVHCVIDKNRRVQLAQHHTATHIVGAAARKVLGNHVNQAGAKKTTQKAHLDITHYDSLTEEEVSKIEEEANKLVKEKLEVKSKFMSRDKAESEYGTTIYQGGAVPGNNLRIIDISSVDIQCCGGTHLHNTSEVGKIKIISATKIQDGIIRLTFVAGEREKQEEKKESGLLDDLAMELDCEINQIPGRASELFTLWKKVVKKKKKVDSTDLTSTETFDGDVIKETCNILKTQEEHLLKTVQRFKKEIEEKV